MRIETARNRINLCSGNVLSTVSDRKRALAGAGGSIASWEPELRTATDYYPFGMQMAGRGESKENYRFGFNGKEIDNEVMGAGNWQDYGERMYSPRLGRFPSPDPLIVKEQRYPWYSSYQFAGNMPIYASDIDGLEPNPETMPELVDPLIAAGRSKRAKASFSIAWDHLKHSVGLEAEFKGPRLGAGLDVDVGPIHMAGEFSVSAVSGNLTGDDLSLKGEILPFELEGGIGGYKAGVSGNMAQGEVVYNINSGDIDGEGSVLNTPNTSVGKREFTIDNSGKIGAGIMIFGAKVKPWVNVGHLAKGMGYAVQGVGQAIGDFFGSIFSRGDRIEESIEVGPISGGRIKE